MTARPVVHATFEVSSGALCYGELHNIWHGASVAKQPFPDKVAGPQEEDDGLVVWGNEEENEENDEDEDGGTVTTQPLVYNTEAENGKWLVYQLKDKLTGLVCGWFACHSSVEPEPEVDRILRVSSSPYEPDCGSSSNDETTHAEAVLVINRYDWGPYDGRGKDEAPAENDELDIQELHVGIGLVDREAAKEAVRTWAQVASHDREKIAGGIWMHIHDTEYQFGRFGFDPERKAARSFLFFTTNTLFGRTTFDGLNQPLREPVDGNGGEPVRPGPAWTKPPHDSGDGVLKLKAQTANPDNLWFTMPADDEYLGPYGGSLVFESAQVDAIPTHHGLQCQFQAARSQKAYRCINEMLLSYVERYVVPAISSSQSIAVVAGSLFSDHERRPSVDQYLYDCLLKPDWALEKFVPRSLDWNQVGDRIQSFLSARSGGSGGSGGSSSRPSDSKSLTDDKDFIKGLVAGAAYLVAEVLQLSGNAARGSSRKKIFPLDMRMAILLDKELLQLFKYSSYYWNGEQGQGQEQEQS